MSKRKIRFDLVQDEDGYPPFSVESVWASATNEASVYEISNIPFFARQATLGDLIEARDQEGVLVFECVVRRSANSLIRVVHYRADTAQKIRADLEALGCSSEWFSARSIIAVNVPIEASLQAVQAYLVEGKRLDLLGYEEPILRQ